MVLAAGVYGTPAVLQRSGIGDPVHLGPLGIDVAVEAPLVGTNLHDHPMVHAGRQLGDGLRAELDEALAAGFVPEEQTLGKARSSLAPTACTTCICSRSVPQPRPLSLAVGPW